MDNLEHVMAQLEKSMAETKRNLAHTEALYQLLKESLAAPAPVITQPTAKEEQSAEPPQTPVMRAYTALMAQVKQLDSFDNESLRVLSNQPSLMQVEFKGMANSHTVMLDVMEYGNGEISYQLEKELLDTNTYSDLFKTDDKLLAFNYIQQELNRGPFKKPKAAPDNYRKLLPELKRVCFSGEVDSVDMEYFADRISALDEAGELTEKQLDKLNRYMDELTNNWIADK